MLHPIEELRGILAADFNNDLPPGVHPIGRWCGEPQFFPGASGLPIEADWDAVRPASRPPTLPEPGIRRVLVLGNYFATLGSYQRLLAGEIGGFGVTWRNLRRLLSPVEPRHVFLTNAYIGVPDLDRDTAAFPKTASFLERCHTLFEHELRPVPANCRCLPRGCAGPIPRGRSGSTRALAKAIPGDASYKRHSVDPGGCR